MHRGFEFGQQITTGFVVVEVSECRNYQLGSNFTGGVPTHAVGEREQPRTGVYRIFVVGTHQADIAAGRIT
jgi:hypothetical protein